MLRRIYNICLAGCFVLLAMHANAQEGQISKNDLQLLKGLEHDLVLATDSMYKAPIPDMRADYCVQFTKLLVKALKVPNSFYYPFSELNEKINIVYPDDKSFRIFNWNIAPTEVTRRYYGAIQMPSEMLKLYPLFDMSDDMDNGVQDSLLTGRRWLGCLYYNILTNEVNGQKVYTLLGLNAGNPLSNRKVIDPLTFTAEGPVFGAPIFDLRMGGSNRTMRFVLEYKKSAQISMNFDKEMNAIYFDRLASDVNDPRRKNTYVPTGQYDGFKWQGDHWTFVEDLIPIETRKEGDVPNVQTTPVEKSSK
ncbi:hypothetical protein ACTHGU_06390 [Chitinophagaceae bacterium MMS25-I14]